MAPHGVKAAQGGSATRAIAIGFDGRWQDGRVTAPEGWTDAAKGGFRLILRAAPYRPDFLARRDT
jgi:hypothetical protein